MSAIAFVTMLPSIISYLRLLCSASARIDGAEIRLSGRLLDMLYTMIYNVPVYRIVQTETYRKWFTKLRDTVAKQHIVWRLERMRNGNFGDSKSVGDGVFELRINVGKGYRVYFTNDGKEIVILLVGGDKSSQDSDIKTAKKMAQEF